MTVIQKNKKGGKRQKINEIYTPINVAKFISRYFDTDENSIVMDPACGSGNLLRPFECTTVGYDLDDVPKEGVDYFYQANFLYTYHFKHIPNIVVCNPPFVRDAKNRCSISDAKIQNICELFLDRIFQLFGRIPVAFVVPITFIVDGNHNARRYDKFLNIWPKPSHILILPRDIFVGHIIHSAVVFFNVQNNQPPINFYYDL
jgi:hypothetical protein